MNKKMVTLIAVVAVLTIAFTAAIPVAVFGGNEKNKKPLTGMNEMNEAILNLQNQIDEANAEIALLKTQAGDSGGVEVLINEIDTDVTINNTQERFWLVYGSASDVEPYDWDNGGSARLDILLDGEIVATTNDWLSTTKKYDVFKHIMIPAGTHTLRLKTTTKLTADQYHPTPPPPPGFGSGEFVCIGFPDENE